MTFLRLVYWVAFVATGVVYGIMLMGTLPAISQGAGGLVPFDMRPTGYSTADAQLFVDQLTDSARALYLGAQRQLDTVFPALFGMSLIGAFLVLVPHRGLRWTLVGVAVCAVLADYVENIRVARMLLQDGALPAGLVSAASQATVAKSILNTICMLSFFTAVGYAVVKRRKAR